MPHERLVMAFTRDGVDLLRLCQGGGHAELDIPDKGFDCGESSVARGRAVATLFLDVGEEVENQRGVDLLEADLGGLDPKPLAGKDEQEPKGMGVGLARVGTATLLDRHVFAQEAGYQRGDGCHMSSPAISASAAAAMSVINSGVASRYQ